MNFVSDVQKACYERIQPMVRELWGEFARAHAEEPMFTVINGSARIDIVVCPWDEVNSIVLVRSWVITGAQLTAEAMEFLLMANYNVKFGAFGIDEARDVFFHNMLLGETLDKDELRYTVMCVAQLADKYDDEFRSRFGGQRFADR